MQQIAIINRSSVVSDSDGTTIVGALNIVLPQFCLDWSIAPTTCVYIKKNISTDIRLRIFLLDTSTQPGALAYHGQANGIPYGKAFAKTVLSYGGVMLYSTNPTVPTVAQAVSHEVFEMLIDPHCNTWVMLPDNFTLYAYEVSDPVQSNPVTVNVQTGTTTTGIFLAKRKIPIYTKVGVSDWVLPSWFNPQATVGPFNRANTLTAPLTIDKHGYVIVLANGSVSARWGQTVTPDKKEEFSIKMMSGKRFKVKAVD